MDFAILEIDENHEIARQAYAMSEGDVQVQQQPFGQFVKVVVYAIVATGIIDAGFYHGADANVRRYRLHEGERPSDC